MNNHSNSTNRRAGPRSARDRGSALSDLIIESLAAQRLRQAALFAVFATDSEATPHGREVSRNKARRSAMFGRRGPWRHLHELGPRTIANLDARIRVACVEAAEDAALPEWVRARAQAFDGFETETKASTRARRNR